MRVTGELEAVVSATGQSNGQQRSEPDRDALDESHSLFPPPGPPGPLPSPISAPHSGDAVSLSGDPRSGDKPDIQPTPPAVGG
jgi:hypothetical protein